DARVEDQLDTIQAGTTEGREQPRAHVDLETRAPDRLADPVAAGLVDRRARYSSAHAHLQLLEDDQSARPDELEELCECRLRIGEMHEDQTPDQGVKLRLTVERRELALVESHVLQVSGLRPLARQRDRGRRAVDTQHPPHWSDELGRKERHVA